MEHLRYDGACWQVWLSGAREPASGLLYEDGVLHWRGAGWTHTQPCRVDEGSDSTGEHYTEALFDDGSACRFYPVADMGEQTLAAVILAMGLFPDSDRREVSAAVDVETGRGPWGRGVVTPV